MIQSSLCKSQHPIFTWQYKYLCSRVDPISEAKEWVANYSAQVQSCSEIIVLGLGCGFHVLELLKEFNNKKIIVIESQTEIWKWFVKNYPIEAAKIKCLVIEKEEDLFDSKHLEISLKNFYTILTHQPSVVAFPILNVYEKWLLGRTYESFNWLSKLRSDKSLCEWQVPSFFDVNKDGITLLELKCKIETNFTGRPINTYHKLLALKELIV